MGQSHAGRRFCLRGAYAELPREIASQIPMSGLPGTDPFGAMSATHKRHCLKASKGYKTTPPSHEATVSILNNVCYHLLAPRRTPSAGCQVRKHPVPSARCPLPGLPQHLCAIGACTRLMHLLPSLRWGFRQPSAELTRAGFFFFRAYTYFLSL